MTQKFNSGQAKRSQPFHSDTLAALAVCTTATHEMFSQTLPC
jgi:hypothetical protein